VRDIVRHPGEMREVELDPELTQQWGEGLVSLPAGSKLEIDARLESVHEGVLVTADARGTYSGVCGRCLTDIAAPVEVEIQELFAYPGEEANDFEVQDDHVDLETAVRDAIVLSLPFQPVCRPDCPGLDPVTGELRADNADAESREPLDPRWAALAGFAEEPADDSGSESTPRT